MNAIGLRRANWSAEARDAMREAVRIACFEGLSRPNAIEKLKTELPQLPEILAFIQFLENTKRGITAGRGVKAS